MIQLRDKIVVDPAGSPSSYEVISLVEMENVKYAIGFNHDRKTVIVSDSMGRMIGDENITSKVYDIFLKFVKRGTNGLRGQRTYASTFQPGSGQADLVAGAEFIQTEDWE